MMSEDSPKSLGERIASGLMPRRAKIQPDTEAVRTLAALLEETGLAEIEYEQDGVRVRVAKYAGAPVAQGVAHSGPAPQAASGGPAAPPAAPAAPHPGTVNSPMVGTVYVSPKPGEPAFVKVGDKVSEGQTLLIIEAMKTMNPIAAPKAGTVLEFLVQDAQPVEFGQALLVVG